MAVESLNPTVFQQNEDKIMMEKNIMDVILKKVEGASVKQSRYTLDKMPSKLKAWLQYSQNFVKVLYSKTTMISMSQNSSAHSLNKLFDKFQIDMFYKIELMQGLCELLVFDSLTADRLYEVLLSFVTNVLLPRSSFELHFIPKAGGDKYKISIHNKDSEQSKEGLFNNIVVRQLNNQTKQENEYSISRVSDWQNIPEFIQLYIAAYDSLLALIREVLVERVKNISSKV